jgi:hypothetical protein
MNKIPIACTLETDDLGTRVDEWKRMLQRATSREMTDAGARITFASDAALAGELADLMAREVDCCAFFTFTLTVANDGIVLGVTAPDDAKELVTAFAAPA